MKVLTVAGARPQFIKAAAISKILRQSHKEVFVHTGQHYDKEMSDVFFDELRIPKPDHYLDIGSGSHGEMTGRMLIAVERVVMEEKPDCVLVYGDTNSTLAGALAAAKLLIPVVHVEAGLRSFNKAMPEEQNRVLTDHLSTVFFCPTEQASINLKAEGLDQNVYLVGDIMADSVLYYRGEATARFAGLADLGLCSLFDEVFSPPSAWMLATIHRAENTDGIGKLEEILLALEKSGLPVIFPVHPRIEGMAKSLYQRYRFTNVCFVKPVGYMEMLYLMIGAEKVITDSGGVQKESYILDTPCITVRDQTEWVETLHNGYNTLAKPVCSDLLPKIVGARIDYTKKKIDYYGDGHAAPKIVSIMEDLFA